MQRQTIKNIITFLILAEIILSLYIIFIPEKQFCAPGFDCGAVQSSSYAYMFGIKLSYFGLLAFSLLFIINAITLYTEHKGFKHTLRIMIILGSLFSLYFLFVQFFILHKVCSSCLTVDSLMILILLISIYEYKKYK